MDKKPGGFWRWYDRASRVDFSGTLLDFVFDWKGWISATIAGSGGAVTFLKAAIDGRSPLDVWVVAVVVAAALVILVYYSISIWEKWRRPNHIDGASHATGSASRSDILDWKSPLDAIEAFAEGSLIEIKNAWGEKFSDTHLRKFESEQEIETLLKSTAPERENELGRQRRINQAATIGNQLAESELRGVWAAIRTDIESKLARGHLIARGFRSPHIAGRDEVEIPKGEWRILNLNNETSEAIKKGTADVIYSGVVIRRAD
jgi:hypothetical protein